MTRRRRKTSRNPKLVGNRRRRTSRNAGPWRGLSPKHREYATEAIPLSDKARIEAEFKEGWIVWCDRVVESLPKWVSREYRDGFEAARDYDERHGLYDYYAERADAPKAAAEYYKRRLRGKIPLRRNGDLAALKARVAGLPRGGEKSRLQWLLDESRGNPSYLREIEYSLGKMGA